MTRKRFGEFLVEEGFITPDQLALVLVAQETMRMRRLGETLVDFGMLDSGSLSRVVVDQLTRSAEESGERMTPIGERLVAEGLVGASDVDHALEVQRSCREARIGDIVVQLGFASREQIEEAIRRQNEAISAAQSVRQQPPRSSP